MSGNVSALGGDARVVHINLAVTFIAAIFNSFLFALATMQTAYYWYHYWKNDRLYLRCMVTLVAVLTTLHMVFCAYTVWSFLIPSHTGASGSGVTGVTWLTYAEYIVDAIGIFAVHTFYLNRLWILSQNRLLVTILGALMFGVFAFGIYTSIYIIVNPTSSILASTLARIAHVETVLCASLAVTDVTTTTSLITLFLRLSNSSMKSERLVKRLIFYTLTTGTLTAISTVVALITNLKFPEMNISAVVYDLGMNLYTCSFLSTLNMRESLREKLVTTGNGFNTGSATMPSFLRFATTPLGGTSTGRTTAAAANVTHAHAGPRRARYDRLFRAAAVDRRAGENTEQAIPGGGPITP